MIPTRISLVVLFSLALFTAAACNSTGSPPPPSDSTTAAAPESPATAATDADASTATKSAVVPAVTVVVDPRVELMSIIFRFAGNPEYTRCRSKAYADEVDAHFAPVKDHPVVGLVRDLRRRRGVSFDAPMSLAIHLTDDFTFQPLVPLDPRPALLDGRWHSDETTEFLTQARDFADKGRFREFFDAHRPFYDTAADRLRKTIADGAHLEWFPAFFGPGHPPDFRAVVSILNGPNCYGGRFQPPNPDAPSQFYCILGVWQFRSDGSPEFPDSVLPTVIHEFGHSCVNPVIERHRDLFADAGRRLFDANRDVMTRQAYGNWETVVKESVLRACVARYRYTMDGSFAGLAEVNDQVKRGFKWTPSLVRLLADYEAHRDTYTTFDDFAPQLADYFNTLAPAPAE